MKNLTTIRRCCLGFLLLQVTNILSAQSGQDTSLYISPDNKFVIWEVNNIKYAAAVPSEFIIPAYDTTSKLKIGFVHSGYSSKEVEGTSALLTMSVLLKQSVLSEAEKEQFSRDHIIIVGAELAVSKIFTLSVTTESDSAEQNRLQKLLGFPKKLTANSVIPIQINWQNVPGDSLYNYLTAANGLHFVASLDLVFVVSQKNSVCFNSEKATKWWKKKSSTDIVNAKGGPDPILLDLIKNGVFANCDSGFIDKRLQQKLRQKLANVLIKKTSGNYMLKRKNLFGTDWNDEVIDKYEAEVPTIHLTISPGEVLKNNKNYIKDLSSDENSGLEALKH